MNKREIFNIPAENKPVILIAPLDWGLGHATRCIALIRIFLEAGCNVIVATDGKQRALLQEEFTQLRFVVLHGYGIRYGNNSWKTIIKIFMQIPKIGFAIRKEHAWLKNFLAENRVDAVVSDNRYGLYSGNIASVFITHQLKIRTYAGAFLDNILQKVNYLCIEKFQECWVPDYEDDNNLAGNLSHPEKLPSLPVKYLGRLTRFKQVKISGVKIELLIILSGPEPQRTIFEQILLKQLNDIQLPSVLIRGLPGERETFQQNRNQNLVLYNHLPAGELYALISRSDVIITRSGYSSIMDLMGLKKKLVVVPTPGQTEQQYLADYLSSKSLCVSFSQTGFSLDRALQRAHEKSFSCFQTSGEGLDKRILGDFVKTLLERKNTKVP